MKLFLVRQLCFVWGIYIYIYLQIQRVLRLNQGVPFSAASSHLNRVCTTLSCVSHHNSTLDDGHLTNSSSWFQLWALCRLLRVDLITKNIVYINKTNKCGQLSHTSFICYCVAHNKALSFSCVITARSIVGLWWYFFFGGFWADRSGVVVFRSVS